MADPISGFIDKLAGYGIRLSHPDQVIADGAIHRLHVEGDKRTAKNLCYLIHADQYPSAWFQDHKRGLTESFSLANGAANNLTPEERAILRERWDAQRLERDAAQAEQYAVRAAFCRDLLGGADLPPDEHPYAVRKGITCDASVRRISSVPRADFFDDPEATGSLRDCLLIPLLDAENSVCSVQAILPDGEKFYAAGASTRAAWHPIKGARHEPILICEGWATGAALHAATGCSVLCAMTANNLEAIAGFCLKRFPGRRPLVMGDNDHRTDGNPGATKAHAAAEAHGLTCLLPTFAADATGTDWDDWLREGGAVDELLASVEQAMATPASTVAAPKADVPRGTQSPSEPIFLELPPIEAYEGGDKAPWEPPLDLWTSRPVPRVKAQYLPSALREFVFEQSALTGTDPTIIAISSLIACAAVIHDGYRVQPKEHDTTWTESARLWGAVVGDPSSRKSPGIATAIKPLKKIEANLAKANESEMQEYEEIYRAWEKTKGKDKGPPPKKPASPRVMIEDTTVEAMSEVLRDNEQGVLVFRDELSGWFGAMDIYGKNGGNRDRSLWLEAYNGGGKRIDRVMRGQFLVPNWSVCLLGGIQPDVFAKIANKLDNDGLLQRFMVVIGASAVDDQDRPPRMDVIRDYSDVIERLHRMVPYGTDPYHPNNQIFKLSEEAQAIRRVFIGKLRGYVQRHAIPDAMVGFVGKLEGLFARLLCTYHLIDAASNGRGLRDNVEGDIAICVVDLIERLLIPHAFEFYDDMVSRSDRQKHAQWIACYVLAWGHKEISNRDIHRAYKPFTRLSEQDRRAVWTALEDYGWIRPAPFARINRGSGLPTRWEVNPDVHTAFKELGDREKVRREQAKEQIEAEVERRRAAALED